MAVSISGGAPIAAASARLLVLVLAWVGFALPAAAQTPQTITFGALANKTYGAAPFTVSATASSGLTVSFASVTTPVCTVSGTTVTIVAAGACTIQASQAGNATYAAAPNVNQSFTVAKAAQTITFGALAGKTYGNAPFAVSATASSGLAVTFTSTTTAVCTVSASTVTIVTAGTCSIKASQAGNGNYNAATAVTQSFTVAKAAQTITFAALSGRRMDQSPFTVSATASSGLAVTFTSTTAAVCTVAGASVTLKAVGTCTIQAAQAGNGNYLAAPSVSQSFAVAKGNQTITFNALANKTYKNPPFTVAATASSGLAVTFSTLTAPVCTVAGTTVTLVAAGTCTIQAAQAGNANWNAAPNVTQSFTVAKDTQTITFNALGNKALGSAPFAVAATATSGLAVTFTSTTTPVCTVSGTTVTLVAIGTCTIQAAQAGNANYLAAPNVSQSFTVTPGAQTITFGALPPQLWGNPPFTVSATASSGLPVSFFTQTPSICTVNGSLVTLLAVGTCVVEAVQDGNANYGPGYAAGSFPVIEPIQFAASVAYAAPGGSGNLALADFNRDGKTDVAVASQNYLAVYPGNGDGTLAAPIQAMTYGAINSGIPGLWVGDFDRDGTPDALTLIPSGDGGIWLNPGNGNYTFGAPSSTGVGGQALAVGDINNDGNLDLVVIQDIYAVVFLGNGSGVFTYSSEVNFGVAVPTAVALADFNGDGKLGIVAIDPVNNYYCTATGNGDGTFNLPSCVATLYQPVAIAVGDFNGDGKADFAVLNSSTAPSAPNVSIYLGRGNGTFGPSTDYSYNAGTLYTAIAVGDFNGDGRLDLALAYLGGSNVDVLAGAGDGTFFPPATVTVGGFISAIGVGDLNADGRTDLAISTSGPYALNVLVAAHAVIPASTITPQSGTPQSATVNSTYAAQLAALVSDSGGHPLAGQQVSFIAPAGGPSGTFSGGSAQAVVITSSAGVATAPAFTANGIAGSFAVTASTASAGTAFMLTNTGTSQQAPAFVSGPPTDGALGVPYSFLIVASGSPAPSISVPANSLPTGLALNGASGLINGTPSAAGTFAGMLTANNGVTPNATQAFAINIAAAAQVISFAPLRGLTFGAAPFTITATASSGLLVTLTSLTTAVCTVSGTTVTIVAAGTCTIQAAQAGNATYAAASNVRQSFTVAKAAQSITFAPLFDRLLGSGTFTVTATASSGLVVTFTSLTTPVCTLLGSTVTLVATGICTLRAAQGGNGNFSAAASVSQSFTVKPAGTDQAPVISFVVPVNNSTYVAPAVIPMLVNATDPDGTIARVDFYNGSTVIGTATTAPFHMAWTGVGAGTYTLTAKAYDNVGLSTSSASVSVTVNAAGGVLSLVRRDMSILLADAPNAFAVGDINGDGKPDVMVVGANYEFLRGDGSGNFVDTVLNGAIPSGAGPGNTAALVDINGDGKLDLLTAYGALGVNLGNGDGTLRPTVSYPLPATGTGLVVGDFTGHGKVDAAVAQGDGTVALFAGNGDGTFQPAVVIPAGVGLLSIAAGDLNGDGKRDLVVADTTDGSIKVLLGNGNGTFQAPQRIVTGTYPNDAPYQLVLGDFNGDGKLDIAVSDYFAPKVTVLIGNGDGTFQPPVDYPTGVIPFGIAAGDFNGDGYVDLVVASGSSDGAVAVLLGNGNGSFQAPQIFATAPGPSLVAAVDLTGAGKADIVVNSSQPTLTILLNETGVTTSAPVFTNGPPPDAVAGVPYTFQFTASGVPAPNFSLSSGVGPIAVAADGTLTATLGKGLYSGVVRASNGIAPDATQAFSILARGQAQTINFPPPPDIYYDLLCASFPTLVTATASSGLAVGFISLTPAVCTTTVDGSVTLNAVGSCTLRAEQWGDDYRYAPAPPVDRTFNVSLSADYLSITSPANGADFVAPASITITAPLGNVCSTTPLDVRFLANGSSIGDISTPPGLITPPYTLTWSNVPAGTYQIVAVGRFSDNSTYSSNPITVVVTAAADQTTVTLTSPAPNSSYFAPATISLAATASDPSANIVQVDFYNGAHIVASATAPPFTGTWSNVPPGTFTLTAKATSSNGVVTSSAPITVSVDSGIAVPAAIFNFNKPWDATGYIGDSLGGYFVQHVGSVAQVASPASGAKPDTCMAASFSGGTIDGNGFDVPGIPDTKISVAFWMYWNGADGAMPFSWATQGLLLSGGNFGFTTIGSDIFGIPSTGLANGWHHVVAEFSSGSVAQNRLYIDGAAQAPTQLAGTPTLANATLSPSFRIGGQLGSTTNRFGGQIDEVNIFYGPTSPTHATDLFNSADPCATVEVSLVEPPSGALFYAPASIDLVASAVSQNGYIQTINFYNGPTLIGQGGTVHWGNVGPGTYTLTAQASDSTGATATSAPVTVNVMTIAGASTVNVQAAGTTFYSSGVVQLYTYPTPAPSYHIVEVSYWLDGIEVAAGSPPSYAVTLQNLAPGTHVITVKVTDDAGYVTTSTLNISVLAGGPSVVYYYNDTAGSPIAASDQNGNVIWEEVYEPYGKRHLNEGGDGNGIWYTGKPVEDVTGLSYFGGRWYSPSIGRFYSVDPQRFKESTPLSFNRYAYCNNNPYEFVDPDGKSPGLIFAILTIAGAAWMIHELTTLPQPLAGAHPDAIQESIGPWDVAGTLGGARALMGGAATEIGAVRGAVSASETSLLRGTNVPGQLTSRAKFWKGTVDDAWENAAPGPTGGKLCPSCGTEVKVAPNSGTARDWDMSHNPSWTNRTFPADATRRQVTENYQKSVGLECPGCNRSGQANDSRFDQ